MSLSSILYMIRQQKKIILMLFLLAFLPRLAALGLLLKNHVDLLSTDGAGYILPALNLLHHGVFSQSPTGTNLIPDSLRTPLYPFFLLPFLAAGSPLAAIAIVQDILFAGTVILVYLMAQSMFQEKTARVASILMAIEPFGIFDTNFITAQNIYYPVFIPAILLILYYLRHEDSRPPYWSSALLGIAALIKPVVIALFPFLLVGIIFKRIPWRERMKTCSIAAIIFLLITGPWLIRNKLSIGTWQFSSISDVNLYASNAHLFKDFFHIQDSPIFEKRFDIPPPEVLATPARTQAVGNAARAFLRKHFGKYIVFHLLYTPRIFIIDQYVDIMQLFFQKRLLPVMPNIYSELVHGSIGALRTDIPLLLRSPVFLISLVGKTVWIFFTFLVVRSVYLAARYEEHNSKRAIIVFSFLFLCWYALVFSPVGRAGYRIPIEFLIFLIGLEYLFYPPPQSVSA